MIIRDEVVWLAITDQGKFMLILNWLTTLFFSIEAAEILSFFYLVQYAIIPRE